MKQRFRSPGQTLRPVPPPCADLERDASRSGSSASPSGCSRDRVAGAPVPLRRPARPHARRLRQGAEGDGRACRAGADRSRFRDRERPVRADRAGRPRPARRRAHALDRHLRLRRARRDRPDLLPPGVLPGGRRKGRRSRIACSSARSRRPGGSGSRRSSSGTSSISPACARSDERARASRRCTTPTRCASPSELDGDLGTAELRPAEVEMAKTLVENLSADFDPAKYDDTYRRELLDLIQAKAKGRPLPERAEAGGGGRRPDAGSARVGRAHAAPAR